MKKKSSFQFNHLPLSMLIVVFSLLFSINIFAQPSEMTLRVTSSSVNTAGTALGSQADLLLPSFFDTHIETSTNAFLPVGVYDGYCVNEGTAIAFSPTIHNADGYPADDVASHVVSMAYSTDAQVAARLNWIIAQNFTSDPKYAGQFNFGEIQGSIWEIQGVAHATYYTGLYEAILTDNFAQAVLSSDIDLIKAMSLSAVTSSIDVEPIGSYSNMILDAATLANADAQPLIIQVESGKLGSLVWFDKNSNGIQDGTEVGIAGATVFLYDNMNNLIATTTTGDDFSTPAIETGYYQFTGVHGADYVIQVDLSTATNLPASVLPNLTQTYDADGLGTPNQSSITLPSAGNNQAQHFGFVAACPPARCGTVTAVKN